MSRIAIIIPYFGKFPNYFPFFLESCRANPTIDWLFFTDIDDPYDWPENVHVHHFSFDEIQNFIQARYDFPIRLERPYKLCDFKPAYGEIFQEYLKGYDFWAHGDCDLIYGNLRKFLPEEILEQNEKIFACGWITFFKNTPEVNAFYRTQTMIPFQDVFSCSENRTFDEWAGISSIWQAYGRPWFNSYKCHETTAEGFEGFVPINALPGGLLGPYHFHEDLSATFKRMDHILYSYENGLLQRHCLIHGRLCSEEIMLIHLLKKKMEVVLPLEAPKSAFLIVPHQFIPYQTVTAEFCRSMTPSRYTRHNLIRRTKNWIKNLPINPIKRKAMKEHNRKFKITQGRG